MTTAESRGRADCSGGRPIRLSFNSSYGVSYQAADLTYPLAAFNGPTGALDPFRSNEPVSALIIAGPNPKLNPETGDAFTLGLTYSSEALHGLRASLNYYDLKILELHFDS